MVYIYKQTNFQTHSNPNPKFYIQQRQQESIAYIADSYSQRTKNYQLPAPSTVPLRPPVSIQDTNAHTLGLLGLLGLLAFGLFAGAGAGVAAANAAAGTGAFGGAANVGFLS